MNNFRIDITSIGSLNKAMEIAFTGNPKGAVGYRIDDKGLTFGWHETMRGCIKLPFRLDAAGAADFATRWLAEQDYGQEPDHDGDNCRGWRLYNEAWGHVGGDSYAIVAVQPAWAMYGK